MKRADVTQCHILCAERRTLEAVLAGLNNNGKITRIGVSSGPPPPQLLDEIPYDGGPSVSTLDFQFPEVVVQAVRQATQQRLNFVISRLHQMGVED